MNKNNRTGTICSPKPATHPREPIDHCYRALLETSSSAILLLSPESIILGWNRAAETVSGWIADEALGRSYVELCLPTEARESFLTELARVTEGSEVRGLEIPLRARTGSQTMLSWNISRVLGTARAHDRSHGHRYRRRPTYPGGAGAPAGPCPITQRGSPGADSRRRGTAQNCTGVARRVRTGLDRLEIRSGMVRHETHPISCSSPRSGIC